VVLDEKRSGRSKIEMNLSTEGDRTPGIEDFTQVDVGGGKQLFWLLGTVLT
jgi:hypothetical protein